MAEHSGLNEDLLEDLYAWIDSVPLTRPKKDLRRDFSDGVMVAELVKHFFPSYVELHNYPTAVGVNKKKINWNLLNRKVFKKLGLDVSDDVINNIVSCQPSAVERMLILLRCKIEQMKCQDLYSDRPEVDQGGAQMKSNDLKTSPHNLVSPVTVPQNKPMPVPPPYHNRPDQNQGLQQHVANKKVNADADMVPRAVFEVAQQKLLEKEEEVEILQAKVKKLEHLIQLKDLRIEDLQVRMNETKSSPSLPPPKNIARKGPQIC